MSVAWFTELYRLNEAGRFDQALRRSDKYLGQRPRDYALHLQRARALVGLGQLEEAEVHLDAAVTHSEGLAAWPFFYRATLHALAGQKARATADLQRAVSLDPSLHEIAARHEALRGLELEVSHPAASGPRTATAPRSPPKTATRLKVRGAPGRRKTKAQTPLEARGARPTAPLAPQPMAKGVKARGRGALTSAPPAPPSPAATSRRRSAKAAPRPARATAGAAARRPRPSGSPRRGR